MSKIITIETVSYMKVVQDSLDSNLSAYIFGVIRDQPGVYAVSKKDNPNKGMTMFYCQKHNRIYPFTNPCPGCAIEPAADLPYLAVSQVVTGQNP